MKTYTVKSGDTLYGISNQFGVSVKDLANLNNLTNNIIRVGEVLNIPSNEGTNPNNIVTYTIKKGDTLYGISMKFNTTVNEIKKYNNLSSNILNVGETLRIPEVYSNEEMVLPEYTTYTVKKGDTLYTIAKNNNISVDTLIKDNALTNNNLSIGQILKIRTNNIGEVLECFGEDYIPNDDKNYITYTVKKGDSLYKIANNYNTSVSNIMKLNNLKSTSLSIGQILKIPSNTGNNETIYIVKKGDSLYKIAMKFNTTVDNIKKKNNLKSNLLSINQKLII